MHVHEVKVKFDASQMTKQDEGGGDSEEKVADGAKDSAAGDGGESES